MTKRGKKRLIEAVATFLGFLVVFYCATWLASALWSLISPAALFLLVVFIFGIPAAWAIRRLQQELHSKRKIRSYANVQTLPEMRMLSHTGFEHYVATIYKAQGYKTEVTPATGDGGIDVVLKKDGRTTGVQVKHYGPNSSVGRPDVQKLVGACAQKNYDTRLFVTTSYFSSDAIEAAKVLNVELVDGTQLERLAKEAFGNKYREKTISFDIERRMRGLK
ncbi:MAG: hypothetical protein RLZZ342_314 [Candidatus Parcubacteria bacterium]|jgi:restriction endonuclease Mrr